MIDAGDHKTVPTPGNGGGQTRTTAFVRGRPYAPPPTRPGNGRHTGVDRQPTVPQDVDNLDTDRIPVIAVGQDGVVTLADDSAEPAMFVAGKLADVDRGLVEAPYEYLAYSELAGPLTEPDPGKPYKVQYRPIHRNWREWWSIRLIVLVLVALDVRFIVWLLFNRSHYPDLTGWISGWGMHPAMTDAVTITRWAMLIGSIGMQLFLLLNVLTVSRACLAARDPIPVKPKTGMRVAFLTTIVPDKEPLEMALRTLRAARQIVYDAVIDVWLLDEGDKPEIKAECERIGVKHFSRLHASYLPHRTGQEAMKSKHGNHNGWLRKHGGEYEIVMFVDTDHVPLPIMAERLLGYFRDEDVAFVVGPQFYGNQGDRITRWGESAQYLFHSVIQRAGNRRRCAMLVGTNAAVRLSALLDIDGYVPSITEDMATSMKFHTTKNPKTGRRWESVYTPDLVAVGEGPSSWTEFFGQQTRWAGGTYDALKRKWFLSWYKLRPGALAHYALMLTYYPSVAIGWIAGILISACYLGLGITSLHTDQSWWLTFYVDIAVMQLLLYRYMRRHNVSPHEPEGSSGFSGMIVSALTAPIYARAFIRVFLRFLFNKELSFNTTAKGSSTSPDRLWTFRYHLMWAIVPAASIASAELHHRPQSLIMVWAAIIVAMCLGPIAVWWHDRPRGTTRRWRKKHDKHKPGQHRAVPDSVNHNTPATREELLPR